MYRAKTTYLCSNNSTVKLLVLIRLKRWMSDGHEVLSKDCQVHVVRPKKSSRSICAFASCTGRHLRLSSIGRRRRRRRIPACMKKSKQFCNTTANLPSRWRGDRIIQIQFVLPKWATERRDGKPFLGAVFPAATCIRGSTCAAVVNAPCAATRSDRNSCWGCGRGGGRRCGNCGSWCWPAIC